MKENISFFSSNIRTCFEGKGVHVITVNDYLAKRDKELIGQVHEFLGLKVGLNIPQIDPAEKKLAYEADITYGIGTEFGFDYLRDNMAASKDEQVQRPYHFAIIDEIDSVLIDEAKTPLIIAGKNQAALIYTIYVQKLLNHSKILFITRTMQKRNLLVLQKTVLQNRRFI